MEEVLLYGDPVGDVGNEHALVVGTTTFSGKYSIQSNNNFTL